MAQIQFYAMGSHMQAFLDSTANIADAELAAVPTWFAEWERILSRFRDDSELTALNRHAGNGWVQVSETLWEVLALAMAAARRSNGLVTPTILRALEQAGYDRDFDDMQRQSESDANAPAPDIGNWRDIQMNRRRREVALPRGTALDFGGIAKGWAADIASRRLSRFGPALVDAGGDIAVFGPRADGTPWPIGIADPRQPDNHIELLLLTSGGVATSGRDIRHWRRGNLEQHHIIDPRTGAPARTDVLTTTVVAPSTREAEAAAKAVLILGSEAGREWLERFSYLAGLVITEAGEIIRTSNLDAFCWHDAIEGVSHE